MAKTKGMRWRGWNTSTVRDAAGLKPKPCIKCKRSFRPLKMNYKYCQSCAYNWRMEHQT